MMYLFHGTDNGKVRNKAFQWVAATRSKAPDVSYIRLSAEDISLQALEEITQTQGLFFSKMLVVLDDPFSLTASGEAVLTMLPALAESANPIAILAPKLLATRVKKIEVCAEKVFQIDTLEKKPARGFNSGLVNALATRDGRLLWQELIRAERGGDAPEMLHGLLHWKARDLMKKNTRGWTPETARALSVALIEVLSDSRGGDLPLSLSLECFALSFLVT